MKVVEVIGTSDNYKFDDAFSDALRQILASGPTPPRNWNVRVMEIGATGSTNDGAPNKSSMFVKLRADFS